MIDSCGAAICVFFRNQPVDSEEDLPTILNGPVDVLHLHYRSKSCVFQQFLTPWIWFHFKSWQVYVMFNPVCYDFHTVTPLFCLDHHPKHGALV